MQKPEDQAREKIDKLLTACGWILQNCSGINLFAGCGIAIREGLLKGGEADAFGERLLPLMGELNLPLVA